MLCLWSDRVYLQINESGKFISTRCIYQDPLPSDIDYYLLKLSELQHDSLKIMLAANKEPKVMEDFISLGYTTREWADMSSERFRELYERTFVPMNQIALNMGFETWKYQGVWRS